MPYISFESGQLTAKIKSKLIERLTEVAAEVTGIPMNLFLVSIKELPDSDIAAGGKSVKQIKAELAKKK